MGIGKAIDMVEPNDEPEAQSSSIKFKKANYTLDGMEEGNTTDDVYARANPARPGFTKSDQRDMWRMGKVQELKVCPSQLSSSPKINVGLGKSCSANAGILTVLTWA